MRKPRTVMASFDPGRGGWMCLMMMVASWALAPSALAAKRSAPPPRPISTAQARRTLAGHGYGALSVSCRSEHRRALCSWSGTRGSSSCSGRLSGALTSARKLRVTISGVRCHADATAPVPTLFGFNTYTTAQTVTMQRDVGVSTTRLFVDWSQVEPSPGKWNWTVSDQSYKEILAGGLRPLLVADVAPCWAAPASGCNPAVASPPDAAHDAAWVAYVKQLVTRYPQAVGVEVWNEPNLAASFWPAPNPARYVQLLQEAYTAVKSVDPTMPVISGGVLMDDGTGSGAGGEASQTFLAAIYADGASAWMDGLGIHVYPVTVGRPELWDVSAMTRWLAQVQTLRQLAAVPDKPIWITEMGVSTSTEPGFPAALTPQQQASDLLEMVSMAKEDPLVRAAMIDSLQDADPNLLEDLISNLSGSIDGDDVFFNEVSEGLGIFSNTWQVKPAACVLSVFFQGTVAGC